MKKMQKGFTLIELLVVIAIIGILSSVVITSMSSARTKAKTAAFKAEVSGLLPALIVICDERDIVVGDVAGGATMTWNNATTPVTLTDVDCYPDSLFSVTITSLNGARNVADSGAATAVCTQAGCTFP